MLIRGERSARDSFMWSIKTKRPSSRFWSTISRTSRYRLASSLCRPQAKPDHIVPTYGATCKVVVCLGAFDFDLQHRNLHRTKHSSNMYTHNFKFIPLRSFLFAERPHNFAFCFPPHSLTLSLPLAILCFACYSFSQ